MKIEEIIKNHYPCTCDEMYKSRGLIDPNCMLCEHGEEIALIAEEYVEQQTEQLSQLYMKPREVLKRLEDIWRKENSPDKFCIPDVTEFNKWIVKKIIGENKEVTTEDGYDSILDGRRYSVAMNLKF